MGIGCRRVCCACVLYEGLSWGRCGWRYDIVHLSLGISIEVLILCRNIGVFSYEYVFSMMF